MTLSAASPAVFSEFISLKRSDKLKENKGIDDLEPLTNWKLLPALPVSVMESLGDFPRIQQKVLYNRGISDPAEAYRFLRSQGSLYDPFLFNEMDQAVETVYTAIDSGQQIAVYGDYDVDGVTASALLLQVLQKLGANARGYIPNRFEEGYGVNRDALQTLRDEGITLTITVDCGIRSPEDVAFAKTIGMEMIITDHHEPGTQIPPAAAVICAKIPGNRYPENNLAGVGLAYKLAEALLKKRPLAGVSVEDWQDFVAIGTVADMVPLLGENRSLVKSGLEKLRTSPKPCIQALAEVSGIRQAKITASTIGFNFGPRLNAAGRLETARLSFDLLMSETLNEARAHAIALNDQNRRRQELTRKTQERVVTAIDPDQVPMLITAAAEDFNMGVVGLAASKLTESFYRPAIVGSIDGDIIHASCRSIAEFHITEALDQCAELMIKHGGHAMAAGLTVTLDNWRDLTEKMTQIAADQLSGMELKPVYNADLEIPLAYLRESLLDQTAEMEPFGMDNPEPLFIIRNLTVASARVMGADKNHLRLTLVSDDKITIEAVAFGQAHRIPEPMAKIDVLGRFEKNEYRDRQTLQLRLVDFGSSAA